MLHAHRLFSAYLDRKPLMPVGFESFIADKLKNTGTHTVPR
jgi:hypothetical protein